MNIFVLVENKRKNISSSDDNGFANKGREKLSMNVNTSPTDGKEENTRNEGRRNNLVWNAYEQSCVETGKTEKNAEKFCFDYETSFLDNEMARSRNGRRLR